MKVAVIFALVALASAGQIHNGLHYGAGLAGGSTGSLVNTGSSSTSRQEDGLGNYKFTYQEQGETGGSSRDESGSAGRIQGSYLLNVGDGRKRTVNYVADEHGYRAQIETNEPGTAPLAGADTTISAPDTIGIAAATNQRTAEQLQALANAPKEIEQQFIAAPSFSSSNLAAHGASLGFGRSASLYSSGYGSASLGLGRSHGASFGEFSAGYATRSAAHPISYSSPVTNTAVYASNSLAYGSAQNLGWEAQSIKSAPQPISYSSSVNHAAPISSPAYNTFSTYRAAAAVSGPKQAW